MIIHVLAILLAASTGPDADQLDPAFVRSIRARHGGPSADGGALGSRSGPGVLGIDSLQNWSGSFYAPGMSPVINTLSSPQFNWQYNMVGRSPYGSGGDNKVTTFRAPIVPVRLDMRTPSGAPRFIGGNPNHPLIADPSQFVPAVVQSPIFSNAPFDSSDKPTQFTDAIFRAEFFGVADPSWHTLLQPTVSTTRTMVVKQAPPAPGNVSCVQDDSCNYRFIPNPDGSCCLLVFLSGDVFFNEVFPNAPGDTSTVVGAAQAAGEVTTADISTFLFDSTYLFFGSLATGCCTLGFHTYDLEPGDASNGWRERRYVLNYSSWVRPGIFEWGIEDVATLSHEMSELFNDPFLANYSPWYRDPSGFVCQDNLETGDVLENFPNQIYPLTLNGFTYHLQNEALLPWFAGQSPSPAIHGAYSYPDPTVLTTPIVSITPAACGL
jgi:hypothetical protein